MMSLALVIIATLLICGGVVWQLAKRDKPGSRGLPTVLLALAVILVPLIGVLGYQSSGSYHLVEIDSLAAEWTQAVNTGADATAITTELSTRINDALASTPDQERLLFLAATLDKQAGRYQAAEARFAHMAALSPNDPQIAAEYAQVSYFANRGLMTPGIQTRLDRALELDPTSRPVLALLAVHNYQNQEPELALSYWQRLLQVLPMDSPNRPMIIEAINQVSAELGIDNAARSVKVFVQGTEDIVASPSAMVFVVARPNSEGAPLAVKRIPASTLPTEVVLSSADEMISGHNIANFEQFIVYAVLSQTGQAGKQQGDWESATFSVDVQIEALDIVIDRQVE
jgi:cytochrome c-type biogenesis protein CcmH